MILNICSDPTVLEVMRIVKMALNVIGLTAIITLVLTTGLSFLKTIKDIDELEKVKKGMPVKAAALLILFFVPTFVSLIGNIVGGNDKNYIACIEKATKSGIKAAYSGLANEAIDKVSEDYNRTTYNYARENVNNVRDDEEKAALVEKLNQLEKYVLINEKIIKLKLNFDKKEYEQLFKDINNLEDKKVKNNFLEKFYTIRNEKPLNIAAGSYKKEFKGINYYVHIPKGATSNMPIIVFLHGSGQKNNIEELKTYKIATFSKNIYNEEFPYILLMPNTRATWVDISATLKELIDSVCDEYSCDEDTISITGHSLGAIGTWDMVSKYGDYFHKAVPISFYGWPVASSFVNVPVRAYVGENSDDYKYHSNMNDNVNSINKAGGHASLTVLSGRSHGETPDAVYTRELLNWMIS